MQQLLIISQAALLIGLIALFTLNRRQIKKLAKRFDKALGGSKSTTDLETTLTTYFDALNATKEQLGNMRSQYEHLSEIGSKALQSYGLVRFNPFRDTGGDQSFALCLLDSNDSGVILTAVHGREGTRIYAKLVEYGQSKSELSDEERHALEQASSKKSKK